VVKDDAHALAWLRKAAEQDQVKAQYTLAAIYAGGLYGLPRDDRQAIGWLRKSARLGYAEAEYALGLAYAEGRGVEKDPSQAYGWLLSAAKQGHPAASAYVKRIQAQVLGAGAKGDGAPAKDAAQPAPAEAK
jgi:TPR repeat protein